jgi:hypothetical protein
MINAQRFSTGGLIGKDGTAFINEDSSKAYSVTFEPLVRQLPHDEEIGRIVQEIAYKQHHEEQADDFLEKVWILKNWLLRQSA